MIEYYTGEEKLRVVRAPSSSIQHALEVARRGLVQHNARYAQIVNLNRKGKLVAMVHRDVLP